MKVGITTTVLPEAIYASGNIPVDLNNIFITSDNRADFLSYAEQKGLPSNLCSWIKGIYAAVSKSSELQKVIAVVAGDCSNVLPLVDILKCEGKEIYPFSYSFSRDAKALDYEIKQLLNYLGTTEDEVIKWQKRLDRIREKADLVDEASWKDGTVTGFENHIWLINCSDFEGNPDLYEKKLDCFLETLKTRKKCRNFLRLGLVGVPPIFSDLYEYTEKNGAKIIFNESQRQFTLPQRRFDDTLCERYLKFTYPYGISFRLSDIKEQIKKRELDGLIHYTQSFCHHQMEHRLLKESVDIPTLLLEGDKPAGLDERLKIRLESFIEMLKDSKNMKF